MDILPPRASGIYQIRCVPTGKVYIGSTVNLRERWYRHQWKLRLGNHHNRRLQYAWNKYGEDAFELVVLELVETSDLLTTEQTWIDKTRCTDRNIGFNISPLAGSPGNTLAQVWEGFIDPDGNPVTISNL
ncbi:MAG TPA: GIY-YIG nuclease family protein, partial [Ktedonobacterales bacterium]|nr:GIY-YIG nuclease family protein [Ktedonobacterales bacterium]